MRETSLFTRPLLRVRAHFTGHRSALIEIDFAVMPKGTKVGSAETSGISAWTKTAKVSVVLPDGSPKRYFLKVNWLLSVESLLFVKRLVLRSARQGRVHELWPRVNFTLHLPSMLWFQAWFRKQPHGESIITANHTYTSSWETSTIWIFLQLQNQTTLRVR